MEISSLPIFSSEELSYFYNSINMDNFDFTSDLPPITDLSSKRRRFDSDSESDHISKSGLDSGDFKGILASLLGKDEEEEEEEVNKHREFEFLLPTTAIPTAVTELDHGRARRAKRASSSSSSAMAVEPPAQNHRRLWVKDRSKVWWEQRNHPDFPEEDFRKDFRMSKATFEFICDELESAVTKKNTMLREAIPVRHRVAVCIWRLATGEPLRLVSKRFGLGISTCHKLVLEVCSAIKTVLMPKFVTWPNSNSNSNDNDKKFEEICGIKNVIGAMYTTHVPIIAPKVNVSAYFNRRHTERNQRTSYSITVQGVTDAKGVFTDVCIGWPGSMTDEKVLKKSVIFQRASMGDMAREKGRIVGGAGYPLLDWLMVPYARSNLTWAQHAFNERVSEARRPAREAFSRLKARWSCLQKRTEVKLQDLPVVLGACCTLHNICEVKGDLVDPDHAFEVFDDEMVASDENGVGLSGLASAAAQARDQIAHHLLHHSFAGTAFL